MSSLSTIIVAIGDVMEGVLDWTPAIINTALGLPLVQFFVALGICGIAYRFAKGLLNLR